MGHQKGIKAHTIASKTQKPAFLESLTGHSDALLVQDRADLMCLVADVSWADDECNEIMQALNPSAHANAPRNDMQHYMAITDFFAESEWTILLDDSVGMLSKREIMCGRACTLGCRCPT